MTKKEERPRQSSWELWVSRFFLARAAKGPETLVCPGGVEAPQNQNTCSPSPPAEGNRGECVITNTKAAENVASLHATLSEEDPPPLGTSRSRCQRCGDVGSPFPQSGGEVGLLTRFHLFKKFQPPSCAHLHSDPSRLLAW